MVTLKNKKGIIQGKSGVMSSDKPLYKTLIDVTKQALKETRFLSKEEVDDLAIEISVFEKNNSCKEKSLETFKTVTFHE